MIGRPTRRRFVKMAGALALSPQLPVYSEAFSHNRSATSSVAFVGAAGPIAGIQSYVIRAGVWQSLQFIRSEACVAIALHPSGCAIYVLNEVSEYEGLPRGSVEAYKVDQADAKMTLMAREPLSLSATMPRSMAIAPDGKSLVIAVHGGGAYNMLPITDIGSLGPVSGLFKATGCGPVAVHQESAHPQAVCFTGHGNSFVSADLGSDRLSFFSMQGELQALFHYQLEPGTGPRHLAMHPHGRMVFVAGSLDLSLRTIAFDEPGGAMFESSPRLSQVPVDGMVAHSTGRYLLTVGGGEVTAWRIRSGTLDRERSIQLSDSAHFEVHSLALQPYQDGLVALTSSGVIKIPFEAKSGQFGAINLAARLEVARCAAFLNR